jgi:hypothetical protein
VIFPEKEKEQNIKYSKVSNKFSNVSKATKTAILSLHYQQLDAYSCIPRALYGTFP